MAKSKATKAEAPKAVGGPMAQATPIRISQEVYRYLQEQGRMGERMEDVIRRLLGLPAIKRRSGQYAKTKGV